MSMHKKDWRGTRTSKQKRRTGIELPAVEIPTHAAKIDMSVPEGLDTEALQKLIAAHPYANREARISLEGKIITGSLQALGASGIAKFDFGGAILTDARLGSVPGWQEFVYDAQTEFPDTLAPQMIKNAEKRTGISMKIIPVQSTYLSM